MVAPDTVIYHKNCKDGSCCMLLVKTQYPESKFIPMAYGELYDTDDISNKVVWILDFSFKQSVCVELCNLAKSVLIIDHHESAQRELEDLKIPNLQVIFDMTKSGAMLTYEYIDNIENKNAVNFYKKFLPLVEYMQDADLYKWQLEYSSLVANYFGSLDPDDFDAWYHAGSLFKYDRNIAINAGEAIKQMNDRHIRDLFETRHQITIANHKVWAVNCPRAFASAVGHKLAELEPSLFGATYNDGPDARGFSLRSIAGGLNVAEIAEQFGGGGHKHAAGFVITRLNSLNIVNNKDSMFTISFKLQNKDNTK